MKPFLWYLFVVLVFGSITGWSNSLNSETNLPQKLTGGYVMHGLLWGGIFFNAINFGLKTSEKIKVTCMIALSLAASAIAYFYFSIFSEREVTRNVLAGWGEDRSTYKEYPFKGYQLLSVVFFILYLVSGLGFWILSAFETK